MFCIFNSFYPTEYKPGMIQVGGMHSEGKRHFLFYPIKSQSAWLAQAAAHGVAVEPAHSSETALVIKWHSDIVPYLSLRTSLKHRCYQINSKWRWLCQCYFINKSLPILVRHTYLFAKNNGNGNPNNIFLNALIIPWINLEINVSIKWS